MQLNKNNYMMQWLYEVFPGSNGIERTSIRIATNCYSAQAIIPERNKLSPELVKGRSIFLIIHNRGQLKQEGTKLSSVEGEVVFKLGSRRDKVSSTTH
ncbi:hypothetical protein CsatB_020751 [Cannabis sativa]